MSRRRYVWNEETKQLEEIPSEWEPTPRTELIGVGFMYDNARATDGTDISSRTKHQAYMKRHGLALADDFKGTWETAKKERTQMATGNFDRAARREAIQRAMYRSKKP